MTTGKLEMFQEAQRFAAGYHVAQSEAFIASFSKYDFFKAVFIAIDKMQPSKENDYHYYFSKLNLKEGKTKIKLLEGIKSLAANNNPLYHGQIDGGLRCISSVLDFSVKDERQKVFLFDEIWDLIALLILHLYEASRSL